MMARFPTLARDAAGTVTIELALIAPILAAMLVGLVDLSTTYSDKLRLEQVAQRTIEKVQSTSFTASMETALEAEAEAAAGTGSDADLTFWLECNGAAVGNYDGGCTAGESYARYVQLDIQKDITPVILQRFARSNSNGTITVHGIAGIRIQ